MFHMRKVFISYAQPDSTIAHRIGEQLTKANIPNWLYERDLKPGDDWNEQTARAMRDCTHGLFLLSPFSLNSPAANFEWRYFLGQNKPLVVAQIQDVQPETIDWRLARIQQVDLTHDFNKGMRSLIDMIRSDDNLITERAVPESARAGHSHTSVTLEFDPKDLDTQKLVNLVTELRDQGIEDIRVVQVGKG
jgi:hypothetical protein